MLLMSLNITLIIGYYFNRLSAIIIPILEFYSILLFSLSTTVLVHYCEFSILCYIVYTVYPEILAVIKVGDLPEI